MSDRTKNLQCIHRAGCQKPNVCRQSGHCTSMTETDLKLHADMSREEVDAVMDRTAVARTSNERVSADDLEYMLKYWRGCKDHIVELSDTTTAERTMAGNFLSALAELKESRVDIEALRRDLKEVTQSHAAAWELKNKHLDELEQQLRAVETSDQPSPLQTERDVYCLALSRLVRRLDSIHEDPRYKAVWESYMLHGGRYTEPTYTKELESARKLLNYYGSPLPPDEFMLEDARDILIKSNIRVAGNEEFILRLMKAYARSPVEPTRPLPDHLKAPVKAGDQCPAIDDVHTEHKGKCMYCGAPMPQVKQTEIRPGRRREGDSAEVVCQPLKASGAYELALAGKRREPNK